MTVFTFIPARGGSARIPSKNLAEVGGYSLVRRACDCAWEAWPIDGPDPTVIVSTDSDEVARAINDVADIHHRPESLAGAHSQIEEALAHWLHRCDPVLDDEDVLCLLQPTSPFRQPATVRECVRLVELGYDSATCVVLDSRNTGRMRSHVDGVLQTHWNRPITSRPRSQEARRHVIESGLCWAFSVRHFRETKLRQGGREALVETSWLEAFEIDTPEDLAVARALVGVAGE